MRDSTDTLGSSLHCTLLTGITAAELKPRPAQSAQHVACHHRLSMNTDSSLQGIDTRNCAAVNSSSAWQHPACKTPAHSAQHVAYHHIVSMNTDGSLQGIDSLNCAAVNSTSAWQHPACKTTSAEQAACIHRLSMNTDGSRWLSCMHDCRLRSGCCRGIRCCCCCCCSNTRGAVMICTRWCVHTPGEPCLSALHAGAEAGHCWHGNAAELA